MLNGNTGNILYKLTRTMSVLTVPSRCDSIEPILLPKIMDKASIEGFSCFQSLQLVQFLN